MSTPKEIYLDANATTPILAQALAAAKNAMEEEFGNPSSTHGTGLRANAMLREVRACAARLLGASQGRVLFTSGATEGIHTAVLSALCHLKARRERGEPIGDLLLYGATEHKAVASSLEHWNAVLGLTLQIEAIPVDAKGRHDLAFLRDHAPRAGLVCTMAANNETGVVSDLHGIQDALVSTDTDALWLVDGVQALGKIAFDLAQWRIDYAAFSGHKLYAPKGIGLLYVRNGAPFTSLLVGGGQEEGLRAGTENMPGIAALGAVLEALENHLFRDSATLNAFRADLITALREAFPAIVFNASLDFALPTTLNFSVPGMGAKELLNLFDAAGIRAGSGSACNSSKATPSHVLLAMGISEERAASAIRCSFGPAATSGEIAAACARIRECGEALRRCNDADAGVASLGEKKAATSTGAPEPNQNDVSISWASLPKLLRDKPTALLIDVRESYEHQVSRLPDIGASVINIPLSRLGADEIERVQGGAHRPMVFFCRSGNRSVEAASRVRGLGYGEAWSLGGGLAMMPDSLRMALSTAE